MGVRMIAAPSGAAGSSVCVTLRVQHPSHARVCVCESHGVVGAHVEQHGYCQSRPASHSRITARHSAAFPSLGLPSEFSFFSFLFVSSRVSVPFGGV